MIKSMTAFGRGEAEGAGARIVAELRTLNHRFLDLHLRLPRSLNPLEDRLRKLVSENITRGRLELSVSLEYLGQSARTLVLDRTLLQEAASVLAEIQNTLSLPQPWSWEQLLSFPEVVSLQERTPADYEALWSVLACATQQALDIVNTMRRQEGEYLKRELIQRLTSIEQQVEVISQRAAMIPQLYRDRLTARLAQLLPEGNSVDPQRLAQEVALLADRSDIAEELARLLCHIQQFQLTLEAEASIGRKLDFLLQEMNREINTIGSKAGEALISRAVIEIKSESERLREQVQNLE